MLKRIVQFVAAHVAALSLVLVLASAAGAQGVIIVPDKDPEMAAAIAKARSSLPAFWAALEKPAMASRTSTSRSPSTTAATPSISG